MRSAARGPALILLLGLLEAFGPLSMDLYMPSLPELADSLGTTDALAQVSMSVCMLGLGLGQLVAGPLSDRHGRRGPLLIGIIAFTALSAACALAPNIEWLLVFRALQGVGGAAGMVITLAIARDLYSGVELSRMLSWLALVGATTPIVAPLIGGWLAGFMDWRGIFFVLCGVGAVLLFAALCWLPESHPSARRTRGGGRLLSDTRALLAPGHFRYILLISAVSASRSSRTSRCRASCCRTVSASRRSCSVCSSPRDRCATSSGLRRTGCWSGVSPRSSSTVSDS